MSEDGCGQPGKQCPGDWFAHAGDGQGELESTTSASLKHVLSSAAALGTEFRMPLEYRAREQKAGNNNFPFSSHDNRHDICNAAEYFDLGMGLRKLVPEKQKQASHNFFEWARTPDQSNSDSFLTVYQSSFVADGTAGDSEGRCCGRFPKHHSQSQCRDEPALQDERAVPPYKPT